MRNLSMIPRLKGSPLRRGDVRGSCPTMRERYPGPRRTYNLRVKVAAASNHAMATSHILRIMFVNQGKVYEVYARRVSHGELFGFIEVEELLFGERSSVVLDP